MNLYTPDRWVIVKVSPAEPADEHYRVFATMAGGYLTGNSWKLNSGITSVTETNKSYMFHGSSGSVYMCNKQSYGLSGYGASVLDGLIISSDGMISTPLPEDTDWLELYYGTN